MALLWAAIGSFAAGAGIAGAAVVPAYSWRYSMISDLGSRACVARAGLDACSPSWRWFNLGLEAAGGCTVLACWLLRGRWGSLVSCAICALGTGLLLLGLIPSDQNFPVHMLAAVLALPVPAAGLLASGIGRRPLGPGRDARTRATLGAVALFACLDHLYGDAVAPVPHGVAQAVSVVALLAFLLREAWLIRSNR